ncbi:MAG: NTP transferase domain-containing protein [Prolixibacteraceae bacterium]|nr:NTP transferase domain-containing protein [Prolixibacteraceae bacterium]
MKKTLLILAAGMGSRFGGLKQIEPIGPAGETILEYSLFDAIRAGFDKVVFVIRKSFEKEFKAHFENKLKGKIEVQYIFQELDNLPSGYQVPAEREKPWGTGHAILVAKKAINEPFAMINADDFYGTSAFQEIADFFNNGISPQTYGMVSYSLKNTISEFGFVARGVCKIDSDRNLSEITERTKIQREGKSICYIEGENHIDLNPDAIVSMNFWGFHPSLFEELEKQFKLFLDKNINTPKTEFFIPSVIFNMIKSKQINVKVLHANSHWFGITYPQDKAFVVNQIQKLTEKGIYPKKLWS